MLAKLREIFIEDTKRDILFLLVSGVSIAISFFEAGCSLPFDAAWIAIVLCGIPIIKEATIALATEFDVKADLLVSLALIAAVLIGEIFAAGEVAFIMKIGSFLEDMTVAKARAGIERLVHLTPRTARIVRNDTEDIIPAERVQVGDVLRVLPGETIPVDGVILFGETSVNQAVMTGESLPVDKQSGDGVSSGTVNQFGAFDMCAAKVGEDSSIQRMIRLVQSADADKAKIVGIADRWATWIVVIALSSALLTWFFTGEIIRSVTILVVFCPCALVLATPTAIMAAIGNATKHGFLVREGDALERLADVRVVAFDKTGTLTHGHPEVMWVKSYDETLSSDALYQLVAAAELRSEHPLGKAIAACYRQREGAAEIPQPESFTMLPGRGIAAVVEGKKILAGNDELLSSSAIAVSEAGQNDAQDAVAEGATIIYTAIDGRFVGSFALADTLRKEGSAMIADLRRSKAVPVLLTGDNLQTARHIAAQLGITEIHANCLPEDKLHLIDDYEKEGHPVCMIGDGVNDAPALKKALVGIAMGGIGSDIAIDAADIALVDDDIRQLPHLLRLAKRMMMTIKVNLIFSLVLNFAAIILAISGVLTPVVGALVHNAGSVLVIINSALLLHWRERT